MIGLFPTSVHISTRHFHAHTLHFIRRLNVIGIYAATMFTRRVYFVHGLHNVILVSVLLLDISIKSGGYSESFLIRQRLFSSTSKSVAKRTGN